MHDEDEQMSGIGVCEAESFAANRHEAKLKAMLDIDCRQHRCQLPVTVRVAKPKMLNRAGYTSLVSNLT
jgi:hypothetical protein